VDAVIEMDTAPRAVELPEDLKASLSSDSAARQFFEQLSFTHPAEWVRWITGAKKSETRASRVSRILGDVRGRGRRGCGHRASPGKLKMMPRARV
jgi:uncharacterized protein YdeI (YjbR/CyaY-like superfamily)